MARSSAGGVCGCGGNGKSKEQRGEGLRGRDKSREHPKANGPCDMRVSYLPPTHNNIHMLLALRLNQQLLFLEQLLNS
eukprot:scaffold3335_cov30-Tisochrysis_lutea.AAC.5